MFDRFCFDSKVFCGKTITVKMGNQLLLEHQNFNFNDSGVVYPLFFAISEYDDRTIPQVVRWHCTPFSAMKHGENSLVCYQGVWRNSTGKTVKTNYVLVCGKTSVGAISSPEYLEEYLNQNATGEVSRITLDYLRNIPYALVCAELNDMDIFTTPSDKPVRIVTGIGF